MNNIRIKYSLIIAAIAAVFFIPFLGGVHLFDWDEVNFAEISREMIRLDDYLHVNIHYKQFFEKPPLFFWLQVLAMKLFGVGEFAARLPNAICGIITLVVLFNIGKTLYSTRFGLIWAGVYFGSLLPHMYFRSGIIDPYFNLFIFLGLYYFIRFYWKKEAYKNSPGIQNKWLYLLFGGLLLGLGLLTKGPVAYLIVCLSLFVYWIFQGFRLYVSIPQFLAYSLAAFSVILIWFGLEALQNGPEFMIKFIKYQYILFSTPDSGHRGFFGYHFVILLFGCFPASIFALRSFFKSPSSENKVQKDFTLWMKILFWVVLILFTIVKTKIVHYSSMAYFPITYLGALVIYKILKKEITFNIWMKLGLGFVGGFFVILTASLPFLGNNIEFIKSFTTDIEALAALDAAVEWTGWEIIPGIFELSVLIVFFILWKKKKEIPSLITLYLGTAIFVFITLVFDINKIEGYSQNAAIEFYKSIKEDDCYVHCWGYKSYAQYFYTDCPPITNPKTYELEWLMTGQIDKPVYVICKLKRLHELKPYSDLKELYRKNNFVFYKREIPSSE